MTAGFFYHTLAQVKPRDAVVVFESPSNLAQFHTYVRNTLPQTFFLTGSGGLGFGLPAAVGLCLAERDTRRSRRVIAIVGDGSAQYSIQALWTAVQLNLPIVFVILRDGAYTILKAFAAFEGVSGVPGLDLPGLDIVRLAEGFGCAARRVTEPGDVADALRDALRRDGPVLLEVPITPEPPRL